MKKNFVIIFLLTSFLISSSCQNVKDALSGSKKNNSDEFLVKKKNPLVMPPDYNEMPKPGETGQSLDDQDYQEEVKELLKVVENEKKESSSKNSSIEEFVIENIKVINSNLIAEKHIKSILTGKDGSVFKSIAFNAKNTNLENFLNNDYKKHFNIAGKMSLNEWKGKKEVEFIIEDISIKQIN